MGHEVGTGISVDNKWGWCVNVNENSKVPDQLYNINEIRMYKFLNL